MGCVVVVAGATVVVGAVVVGAAVVVFGLSVVGGTVVVVADGAAEAGAADVVAAGSAAAPPQAATNSATATAAIKLDKRIELMMCSLSLKLLHRECPFGRDLDRGRGGSNSAPWVDSRVAWNPADKPSP